MQVGANMRLTALDGWRGILSLLVILAHFPGPVLLQDTRFYESGSTLIDLFFLFSGFVIVAAYEKKLREGYGTGRFLVERLGRIYPIHFVVLAIFVLTELVLVSGGHAVGLISREPFDSAHSVASIFTNLTLTQAFDLHDELTWNYPSWSLSTEWAAYVLFALCMMIGPRRFWPFALIGVIVSPLLLATFSDQPMRATYDYGVFRSTYGFSAGALTYYVYRWITDRKIEMRFSYGFYTVAEIGTVILLFGLPLVLGMTPYAVLIPLGYMPILLVLAIEKGALSRWMSFPLLVHIGTISLSIYVIHAYILFRLVNIASVLQALTGWHLVEQQMFHGAMTKIFVLDPLLLNCLAAATIALIVLISHYTHRYIEVPAEKKVRLWAKRIAPSKEPSRVTNLVV